MPDTDFMQDSYDGEVKIGSGRIRSSTWKWLTGIVLLPDGCAYSKSHVKALTPIKLAESVANGHLSHVLPQQTGQGYGKLLKTQFSRRT